MSSDTGGESAWEAYRKAGAADSLSRQQLARAVRHTLAVFERAHPGRAVELRVVPFGAVSVLEGTKHRRGAPPAVVEMDGVTWLALAAGTLTWAEAEESGAVDASGERSDLSRFLPMA